MRRDCGNHTRKKARETKDRVSKKGLPCAEETNLDGSESNIELIRLLVGVGNLSVGPVEELGHGDGELGKRGDDGGIALLRLEDAGGLQAGAALQKRHALSLGLHGLHLGANHREQYENNERLSEHGKSSEVLGYYASVGGKFSLLVFSKRKKIKPSQR